MTKTTTLGQRVRVTQTRTYLGRTGTVVEVHASISGDTLITIADDNGGTFQVYDRQVRAIA